MQSVDFGGQDEQTMNGVAMETPSDVAVALATKHANMSWLPSSCPLVARVNTWDHTSWDIDTLQVYT